MTQNNPAAALTDFDFFILYIATGDAGSVRACLKRDPKLINMTDSGQSSPLHFAVLNRQLDIVTLLLDYGPSVNHANARGLTPLHCATFSDTAAIARVLLEHGADPCLRAHSGQTVIDMTYARVAPGVRDAIERFEAEHQMRARVEEERARQKTEETLTKGVVPDPAPRIRIRFNK